ncbi:hypothetical protein RQM65_18350 [Pricia sp. S334]|uniref:Type VI secretion system baseplate subunit TssF n=1 Tax=Pricia mediterranea TaxID=3076079 RepID=A0ABU3LC45_9FLAO|nr:hypothetical protein [Pricia sp. S334]MDT7830637.1 hypothetical protein [Pricia sp. S334]
MDTLTKEEIKDRLIRRAAQDWGVDEMEIESSFDPIASLLFDACAHEFERLSNAIKSSRTQVTERLVDLLTPEISVTAKPAHAVMHALPLDAHVVINEHSQFYHRKRTPIFTNMDKNGFEDIYFCPAGEFKLNNCDLSYIASPAKVLQYGNQQNLPFLAEKDFSGTPENNCIYLAIRPGKGVKNIDQLLCYFDLLNFSHKQVLAHHIGIAHWSLNGETLQIKKGYNDKGNNSDDISKYVNKSISTKMHFYENYVKKFYDQHFYTIESPLEVNKNVKKYPEAFTEFLTDKQLKEFEEPLLWIKIEFYTPVPPAMLEHLHCHINCFPVLNKKSLSSNKRLQPFFNILPLETGEDYFFDIQSIVGDSGTTYFQRSGNRKDDGQTQAYLRFGGVAKFDERDSSELLNYTLDLLKEDCVAFTALGDSKIENNLKELKKIMSRIGQQVELNQNIKHRMPYLIITGNRLENNRDGHVFVDFWTTAGKKANKINPYVKMNADRGMAFQPDSLTLITGSIGGENEPSPSEKIYAYRENVLSRGRIVTRQDIVHYCFGIYRDSITNVTVDQGVVVSQELGVGYTPTTDIHLLRNPNSEYRVEDWDHLKKELLIGLRERSANVLPFRVFYSED